MSARNRPRALYFIASRDRSMVKIGVATDPNHRFKTLCYASPVPLDLLVIAPGSFREELAAHCVFGAHYSHGEWFHGHSSIYAAVAYILDTGQLPEVLHPKPEHKRSQAQRPKRTAEQRAGMSLAQKQSRAERLARAALNAGAA